MAAGYDEVTAPSTPSLDQAIRLIIPAKPEYISLARLALTGLSRVRELDPETLADLKLAITEATSNSVRHAYSDGSGTVEVLTPPTSVAALAAGYRPTLHPSAAV